MKERVQLLLLVVFCSAQFVKALYTTTVSDVKNITDTPYVAFIEDSETYSSGNGAIISDTHVITSVSTVDPTSGATLDVYVGNIEEYAGTLFRSKNYQKHPSYNRTTLENNVAIITINGTFNGLPNVKPIALATSTTVNPANCFIAAWGIYINSLVDAFLRRIDYQFVTDQECTTKLGPHPPTIQCASSLKGTGVFGLKGFPLVCDNQLIGILAASSGYSFTNAQPIDLFTNLTAASIKEFVFGIIPRPNVVRKNYVSCN